MRDLLRGLVELLLPAACAGCGRAADDALCAGCRRALPRIPRDLCALCQRRPRREPGERCAGCARRRAPLAACVAGCWYEGDAGHWVRAFKYPSRWSGLGGLDRARMRALALETLALAGGAAPDAVVPVPLHPARLRMRGFNPAASIARDLARSRGVPLRARALRRLRDTPSQTGLGRRARRRNVRGAFRATAAVPPRVWLVDDVVTTGATLEEAARALRRAGAREVRALCAVRTPPAAPTWPGSRPG